MRFLVFTVFISLLASPAFAIVGGTDVTGARGARQYTVGIVTKKGEICSGAVIAQDIILTAAHCLVRGGVKAVVALDENLKPRAFAVAKTWRNPKFIPNARPLKQTSADLGVLLLAAPLPSDMIPVDIAPDLKVLSGADSLSIAGFGVSRYGAPDTAFVLREATLKPIGLGRVGAVSLLASADGSMGASASSACLGDSGGPVVVRSGFSPVLVGIISWVGGQRGTQTCQSVTVAAPTVLENASARRTLANAPERPSENARENINAVAAPSQINTKEAANHKDVVNHKEKAQNVAATSIASAAASASPSAAFEAAPAAPDPGR
jgi:hypothetical protein